MKKALTISLILMFTFGFAHAADVDSAQNVRIDQTGANNDIDITSGTINTLENVGIVSTVTTVSTVTQVNNVTSVDTVDVVQDVDNVDIVGTVTKVSEVTTVNTVNTVSTVNDVTTVETVKSVSFGTITIQDVTNDYHLKIFSDGAAYVRSSAEAGNPVSRYYLENAVAAGTEVEAGTYAVTSGTTLYFDTVHISASGLARVRITVGGTEVIRAYCSPTQQTAVVPLYQTITAPSGSVVTVYVMNRETTAMDISAFWGGREK
jgi:hypothetical protein